MSYSLRLPEEDPVCECKYDTVHDRMDREDCPFHWDFVEDQGARLPAERKPPASIALGSRGLSTGVQASRESFK